MAGSLKSNSRFQRHRRSGGAAFSDINVTPLVDVMLVLLIVFMVTAPMLTVGIHVDLPKTQAAKLNDQVEPIVISVDAAGKAYLQEMELEGDALIARLKAITDSNPDARIYVRGDKSLAYGRVMEIMGEVAASGFSKVSLIAEMPMGSSSKVAPKALPMPVQKPIVVSKPQKPVVTQPKPTPKAIHPKAPVVGGKATPVKPAAKKGQ
jgi:biopolymer transport protein TolR